jgi:hypothetical protein
MNQFPNPNDECRNPKENRKEDLDNPALVAGIPQAENTARPARDGALAVDFMTRNLFFRRLR